MKKRIFLSKDKLGRFSTTDYLNRRYGKLLVIKCIEKSNGINKGGAWLCKCDCGNIIKFLGYKLYHNHSCGCLRREARLKVGLKLRKYEQITISDQYRIYKNNCRCKKFIPLVKEKWLEIVLLPCYYCGQTDERNFAKTERYAKRWGKTLTPEIIKKCMIKMNGIDRLDSNKGYNENDNTLPCCAMCNYMKNNYNEREFLERIELIYKKRILKNFNI